jgi:hypothetical protein
MESDRPSGPAHQAPGQRTRARRDNARAEAIDRVARWKRGIGAGAVVCFGALIGVVGIAGARGAGSPAGRSPASGPRSVTSPSGRDHDPGGSDRSRRVDPGTAPSQAPDDGYFGNQDGGYGFGGGSPSAPLAQSGAS